MRIHLPLILLLLSAATTTTTTAKITDIILRQDPRNIIRIDEFGFTRHGRLELNLSPMDIYLGSDDSRYRNLTRIGFFLCTTATWRYLIHQIEYGEIDCPLDSIEIEKLISFDHIPKNQTSEVQGLSWSTHSAINNISSTISNADQFTLIFVNCNPKSGVYWMGVRSELYNLEGNNNDVRDYLSVGKTFLPQIYFFMATVYFVLSGTWIYVLYKKRSTVFKIHCFMLAVVLVKALNLLCEAEDKSYIKRTGNGHGWDIMFYISRCLKAASMSTLIVLIGSGWSLLKPSLEADEKEILSLAILLQVLAKSFYISVDVLGPYQIDWDYLEIYCLVIDVSCCCMVLSPIAKSIKKLRESATSDGRDDDTVNLSKLRLFRQYYIVFICYVYVTRVIVYLLETKTSYQYFWTSVVVGESATLAFYIFTGLKFKPEAHNPYLAIDNKEEEEEEAEMETLKPEDEFVDRL